VIIIYQPHTSWLPVIHTIHYSCNVNNYLPSSSRLGVKATTLKAKAKAKDLAFEAKAKAKAKDLAFKAKDLASKAKAKDDVKANVNMVRCSVKTSKHRRLLQGW